MGKYLYLQLKRLLRIIIPVLLVATVLFGCLALAYQAAVSLGDDTQEQAKLRVGVVGTVGDTYLELGMMALTTFDSSRLALSFEEMEEDQAEIAMRRGKIVAFVVIPDGFMDEAMHGHIMPLKYVSTSGSVGLVSLMKDEITQIVENIMIETQKGIYGAGNAAQSVGASGSAAINDISLEYMDFIFARSKMYRVSELGGTDGMGLEEYLLSGFCVVMLMLVCLVFAPVMVRRDMSLGRVLSAGNRSVLGQVICDFTVYFLGIFCVVIVLMLFAVATGWVDLSIGVLLQWAPIVIAVGGMSFLLYELSTNMISGVLLQFFVSLALCFVSGCLYPISFFPDSVQRLSGYLPTGIARAQLAASFAGDLDALGVILLLGYGVIFFVLAAIVRKVKVALVRG